MVPPSGIALANPDSNGGTLRYAAALSAYGDPLRIDTFLVSSTCTTPLGGNVTVTVFAPQKTGTPYLAALALGTVAAVRVPLPCVAPPCPNPCVSGLDPIAVVLLGPVDLEAGDAAVTFPVPAGLPAGVALDVQGIYLDVAGPGAHSSNLGRVRIETTCR